MDLSRTIPTSLDEEEASRLRGLLAELGELASKHRFLVAPNPCVGAAVLSGGVEVGRGFHECWGEAHAEVFALEAAEKSGVRADTLVCTLEPCSTEGKTPPCTEAILRAGIRRVVVAALDPDSRHSGRGLESLQAEGLQVIHLSGVASLEEVSPHFLWWTRHERVRRPRPWTVAKWAQTRTGQLRPPEDVGGGRWISGPVAQAEVQVLRSRVDAIVTGVGTVLADDPRLTVREPAKTSTPPLRVVLDSRLRTPPDARLFAAPAAGEAAGDVVVITLPGTDPGRRRGLEEAGARIETVRPGEGGRPSLRGVTKRLWEAGVRRAMLEAGPTLLEAWFQIDLVDQIKVYTGNVSGGRGPTLAERLDHRHLLEIQHQEIGEDAVLDAFVKH